MRRLFILTASLFFLFSCSNQAEEQVEEVKEEVSRPLIERKDGTYTEWYPGHKQMKVRGRESEDGQRIGIWKAYSPNGVELSVTVYTDDKKDGHIVVRHPNGAVHYVGEYMMDERVGEWRFYDETGTLIKEEDFGYPEN